VARVFVCDGAGERREIIKRNTRHSTLPFLILYSGG
jgi:hypothetical protein